MLDELLENKIIELPEAKRPKELGKTPDPNYCRYHRLISHPIEKCVTLKEKIMRLAQDGTIVLDLDETVGTNHASVIIDELPCQAIQFGSLEPVMIQIQPIIRSDEKLHTEKCVSKEDDDGGWTLVTRRR